MDTRKNVLPGNIEELKNSSSMCIKRLNPHLSSHYNENYINLREGFKFLFGTCIFKSYCNNFI